MGFCNCCFDFDLKIDEKADNPIILYNFIFEYQDKKISYDYELHLPIETAFIILANTCTIFMSGHFNYLIKFKAKKTEFIFDEKLLKQLTKKNDDSLFHFKSGFSEQILKFTGWQLIIDESIYNDLINLFNLEKQNTTKYFPAYRKKQM